MLIYVLLAIGLNILVGYAGQLAFANAAMFGIGAYGTGLLQVHLGWSFWLAFPLGALIATAVGLAISLPALRLSGLYLALSTLAFAQATQWVFLHWERVTFGAGGFKTPPLSFAPLPISKPLGTLLPEPGADGRAVRCSRRISCVRASAAPSSPCATARSPPRSLGVDLLRYKALAFGISGFYAGVAGGLYSAMLNFVAPEGFDLFQMVLQKAMIVVGGLGSVVGSVLGAGAHHRPARGAARVQGPAGDRVRRPARRLRAVHARRHRSPVLKRACARLGGAAALATGEPRTATAGRVRRRRAARSGR